jgi:hypothetical protein
MKYFIDTEFLEGTQDKTIFGIKYGKTKPTIDLISIGIVAQDGREYYAISKDFNLKEAWNRYDEKSFKSIHKEDEGKILTQRIYWIRENVLKPIFKELEKKHCLEKFIKIPDYKRQFEIVGFLEFNYSNFKMLVKKYGKTNKQIAEEIKEFTYVNLNYTDYNNINSNIEFYAYYADYDWVAFCWLFGTMNDLPNGFPKYCKDLKQILDDVNKERQKQSKTFDIKKHPNYPNQTNEHNALADAKWNKKLYKFLNIVKPKLYLL